MVATSNTSASKIGVALRSREKRFKGVRMRSWGRWVSEIRLPNTRARLWLGSYATAEQAARAFDVAVLCLRGSSAALNFPESPPAYAPLGLPHRQIQELATAAAATVLPPHASPSSPSADSRCHVAMCSLETSSLETYLISDESDTTTYETSSQSSPVSTSSTFEELLLLDEQQSSASSSSAALNKELLLNCEWDEPLWGSSAFDCWITAPTAPAPLPIDLWAPLPVDRDGDDDNDNFFGPHCLWSL